MSQYNQLFALPFLGMLNLVVPGTQAVDIHYRKVNTTLNYTVSVPARAQDNGGFGNDYFTQQQRETVIRDAAIRAYITGMVRTAAQGYNVRTVRLSTVAGVQNSGYDPYNLTPDDSTAALETVLAQAAEPGVDQLVIEWDVCPRYKNLNIRSNTLINANYPGAGGGYMPGNGTPDNNGVRPMGNRFTQLVGETYEASNIVIKGGIWNGDGIHQRTNSPLYGWMTGMTFMSVKGLWLDGCTITNARSFGLHLGNTNYVYINNCTITAGDGNTDPIHNNFLSLNHLIENCKLTGKDDHIAYNCADAVDYDTSMDGTGKPANSSTYYTDMGGAQANNCGTWGVSAYNIRVGDDNPNGGGRTCLRFIPGGRYCKKIWYQGISGNTHEYWGIFDYFDESTPNRTVPAGTTVPLEDAVFFGININVTPNGPPNIACGISCNTKNIAFYNLMVTDTTLHNNPKLAFTGSAGGRTPQHMGKVIINGTCILDQSQTTATPYTSDYIVFGSGVDFGGQLEMRDGTLDSNGTNVRTAFAQFNRKAFSRIDVNGLRVSGIANALTFNDSCQITQLTALNTKQVGGTAFINIKDTGSVINTITTQGTFQGTQLLQSASASATTTA